MQRTERVACAALVCFVVGVLWLCAGGLWCVGGVCSVLCRRRDSPPGYWESSDPVVGVEILSLVLFSSVWRVFASGWLRC